MMIAHVKAEAKREYLWWYVYMRHINYINSDKIANIYSISLLLRRFEIRIKLKTVFPSFWSSIIWLLMEIEDYSNEQWVFIVYDDKETEYEVSDHGQLRKGTKMMSQHLNSRYYRIKFRFPLLPLLLIELPRPSASLISPWAA